MTIEQFIIEIIEQIQKNKVIKMIFSNFRNKEDELEKVIATALLIKNKPAIQFEYRYKRILKHINIHNDNSEELTNELNYLLTNAKDINIQTENEVLNAKVSKN